MMRRRWVWVASAVLLAGLLVAGGGCYDSDDFGPTAPEFHGALTLTTANGQTSLRADGISRLELVARISPDASPSRRTVVFSTTAGTLVGAGAGGTVQVVADTSGLATAQLQSPQQVGTAEVSASVMGVDGLIARLTIQFTAAEPSDIIRFLASPSEVPADGASVSTFEVAISESLPLGSSVEFQTTAGTFLPENSPMVTRAADGSFVAAADLKSPDALGSGRVTAEVDNVSVDATIQFVRALPNRVTVSTGGTSQLAVASGAAITVTATYVRNIGDVTEGTVATFRATDATGAEIGFFRDLTTVGSSGQATASFVPGTTTYRGRVTLTAGAQGTSVTGSTDIELVDP